MDTLDITMVVFHSDLFVQAECIHSGFISLMYLNIQLSDESLRWEPFLAESWTLLFSFSQLQTSQVLMQELTSKSGMTLTESPSGFTVKEQSHPDKQSRGAGSPLDFWRFRQRLSCRLGGAFQRNTDVVGRLFMIIFPRSRRTKGFLGFQRLNLKQTAGGVDSMRLLPLFWTLLEHVHAFRRSTQRQKL